jgi:hypothetical protein
VHRLAGMRVEYGSVEKDGSPDLDVDWFADGWLALLHIWIDEAEQAGIVEPNAMVLATVDEQRGAGDGRGIEQEAHGCRHRTHPEDLRALQNQRRVHRVGTRQRDATAGP